MARATARVLIVPHLPRYAIVMAGGAGTRFWPRSRVHTPKQLLALRGGRSLLQETVARVSPPIRRERVLVVTARPHAHAVARQLARRGRGALLVEPEGRNTAAAIALAALYVARRAPEAVLAVLPADHVIDDVLWNSGIFAWRASAILAALRLHLPEVVGPLERAGTNARALAAAYRRLPAVSIDHGVLERAERVAVVRARFPWSDVGSWAAVAALWSGGNGRNALRGRTVSIDSRGCLVDSPERLVAVLGVDDLVVVDTPDAVLVCRKDRAQDVRLVVDELRRR